MSGQLYQFKVNAEKNSKNVSKDVQLKIEQGEIVYKQPSLQMNTLHLLTDKIGEYEKVIYNDGRAPDYVKVTDFFITNFYVNRSVTAGTIFFSKEINSILNTDISLGLIDTTSQSVEWNKNTGGTGVGSISSNIIMKINPDTVSIDSYDSKRLDITFPRPEGYTSLENYKIKLEYNPDMGYVESESSIINQNSNIVFSSNSNNYIQLLENDDSSLNIIFNDSTDSVNKDKIMDISNALDFKLKDLNNKEKIVIFRSSKKHHDSTTDTLKNNNVLLDASLNIYGYLLNSDNTIDLSFNYLNNMKTNNISINNFSPCDNDWLQYGSNITQINNDLSNSIIKQDDNFGFIKEITDVGGVKMASVDLYKGILIPKTVNDFSYQVIKKEGTIHKFKGDISIDLSVDNKVINIDDVSGCSSISIDDDFKKMIITTDKLNGSNKNTLNAYLKSSLMSDRWSKIDFSHNDDDHNISIMENSDINSLKCKISNDGNNLVKEVHFEPSIEEQYDLNETQISLEISGNDTRGRPFGATTGGAVWQIGKNPKTNRFEYTEPSATNKNDANSVSRPTIKTIECRKWREATPGSHFTLKTTEQTRNYIHINDNSFSNFVRSIGDPLSDNNKRNMYFKGNGIYKHAKWWDIFGTTFNEWSYVDGGVGISGDRDNDTPLQVEAGKGPSTTSIIQTDWCYPGGIKYISKSDILNYSNNDIISIFKGWDGLPSVGTSKPFTTGFQYKEIDYSTNPPSTTVYKNGSDWNDGTKKYIVALSDTNIDIGGGGKSEQFILDNQDVLDNWDDVSACSYFFVNTHQGMLGHSHNTHGTGDLMVDLSGYLYNRTRETKASYNLVKDEYFPVYITCTNEGIAIPIRHEKGTRLQWYGGSMRGNTITPKNGWHTGVDSNQKPPENVYSDSQNYGYIRIKNSPYNLSVWEAEDLVTVPKRCIDLGGLTDRNKYPKKMSGMCIFKINGYEDYAWCCDRRLVRRHETNSPYRSKYCWNYFGSDRYFESRRGHSGCPGQIRTTGQLGVNYWEPGGYWNGNAWVEGSTASLSPYWWVDWVKRTNVEVPRLMVNQFEDQINNFYSSNGILINKCYISFWDISNDFYNNNAVFDGSLNFNIDIKNMDIDVNSKSVVYSLPNNVFEVLKIKSGSTATSSYVDISGSWEKTTFTFEPNDQTELIVDLKILSDGYKILINTDKSLYSYLFFSNTQTWTKASRVSAVNCGFISSTYHGNLISTNDLMNGFNFFKYNNDVLSSNNTLLGFNEGIVSHNLSYNIPCLTEKTKVLTNRGYINVENLTENDYIITNDFREVKIISIHCDIVTTTDETSPYFIPSNYFRIGYPSTGFSISPLHAVSINNKGKKWFIPEEHGKDLQRCLFGVEIKYYHVELPNWLTDHLVIEGGTVVESYGENYHKMLGLDAPMMFVGNKSGYYIRNYELYEKLNNLKKSILI